METIFEAGSQYNDYKGTAAADGHQSPELHDVGKIGLQIKDGEYVKGIRIGFGEISPHVAVTLYAFFLIATVEQYKETPPVFREECIKFEGNLEDFFRLFKRFDVTLSIKGALEGKTCFIEENPPE